MHSIRRILDRLLAVAFVSIPIAAGPATAASAQTFVGQVLMLASTYCPQGYIAANGALLSIPQNSALFSLLGTRFGGDGIRTFALPNLGGHSQGSNTTNSLSVCIAVQGVYPSRN